jgi:hypothetical protein
MVDVNPEASIVIVRETFTDDSTMGELYFNSEVQLFTLEPPMSSYELVPVGTYLGILEFSPRFQTITPHLKGVPGYDDNGPHGPIEIHWGNYPGNTEGCCIVGTIRGINFVGNSRAALETLVSKLPKSFTVTYENA